MQIPASCLKPPRSAAGAVRQYATLYRMYTRAFDGGGSFGWDLPTLCANWPEGYARMRALLALIEEFNRT